MSIVALEVWTSELERRRRGGDWWQPRRRVSGGQGRLDDRRLPTWVGLWVCEAATGVWWLVPSGVGGDRVERERPSTIWSLSRRGRGRDGETPKMTQPRSRRSGPLASRSGSGGVVPASGVDRRLLLPFLPFPFEVLTIL
ncbi:unnamed protein product [Linum trigynum]|uniref:Uncharacterized protein n=1 Tax=Linum trigynum TaxID=586398 RepID=A0AAV2DTA4_9ROSI